MDMSESLLRAILMTLGRGTFPPGKLYRIIAPQKNSSKNLLAYNACDGNTSQAEIAKKTKLDKANFSKLLARWVDAGIMIRVDRDQFPLHLYPLTPEALEQAKE
jgi:DNA-binding MarR family transcriptional regulator